MPPSWPQKRPRQLGRKDPEPHTSKLHCLLHPRKGGTGQNAPGEESGVEAGNIVRVRDDRAGRPRNIRVIAAVIEIPQPPRLRQLRLVEPERFEDALPVRMVMIA